jgi:RNA-directed DNA polymerase
MTKSPISLQDLRRRIYVKAKAESTWCFWGLYVHICKMETLQAAYQMAKSNHGAPGIDGITFDVIEESGVESFLKQIQDELVHNTYQPMPVRKREIPKNGGNKVRVLSIPTIRDRVRQSSTLQLLDVRRNTIAISGLSCVSVWACGPQNLMKITPSRMQNGTGLERRD